MKPGVLARLAAFLLLIVAIGVALLVLPVREYLAQFLAWARGLGIWGPILLVGVYIGATVLFVPGFLITLGAGFAFGVVPALVAVSLGSTLGAAAAFLLGRFLARGWIEAKVAGNPRFQALDRAVGAQGFKIVLLTRLSLLLPYNMLNYAYGLTRVRLWDFLLGSWLGMFPATVVYVYLGSAASDLADLDRTVAESSPGQRAIFYVGLAATVLVTVFVTRLAKRALDDVVEKANGGR